MKLKKLFFIGLFLSFVFSSLSAADTDSVAFTKKLGIGYNWGNTFDCLGGGITGFEVGWGAPVSTKEMFEDLKARGFDSIRLPVAWSREMSPDYKIADKVADRVNEVVDYAIDSGLYVILNIHWDGGWINDKRYGFQKNYKGCMEKYTAIWNQICERYQDYDEHLVFESLNEEGHWEGLDMKTQYKLLNKINQTFVDIVRSSGGKNKDRYLLIAGYNTDIAKTCVADFKMPEDKKNRCMISVHYYTPSTFAILTENASWGMMRKTWGTNSDISELKTNMKKMKTNFHDKGIGVIIGEYGCPVVNKDPESIRKYLREVSNVSYDMGFCPVLWAGSTDIYNRRELKFDDEKIGDDFLELSKKPRN